MTEAEMACVHSGCQAEALEREVEAWRMVAARTARIIEAQTLDLKAIGKNRRQILEHAVWMLRQAAVGDPEQVYASVRYLADELDTLRKARSSASL